MTIPEGKSLILFDGYCHLCSGLVQYLLRHDSKERFLFCPLDSDLGRSFRKAYQIADSIDSIILIENNKAYIYSEAVFRIAVNLGAIHKLILIGRILPKSWSESIYRWGAKNRYGWFGKRETCMLPDVSFKDRFL